MPVISKIRFTNVIYENGGKRYNDMLFHFDGHNGAFLLENGGGKTVFIQTALQAIIPHVDMAGRKIKDTLTLESSPAHIAIEWILNESPRIYGVTAVSLYMENNELKSLKYVYEYKGEDPDSIEDIPFVVPLGNGKQRPASRGEISDYYSRMTDKNLNAHVFRYKKDYEQYLEENFKIVASEWKNIATINSGEGNVDEFFSRCKTTQQLLNNLLIPTVEEAIQGESTKDFVNTFEKQREHFKTNKRLLEEIEQFKMVKLRVDDYVEKYAGLHTAIKDYEEMKSHMKSLNNHVTDLKRIKEQEKVFLEEKMAQLQRETDTLKHKEISLAIRIKEKEIEEIEEVIRQMNGEYDKLKTQYDEVASRKQNIEISKLTKRIKTNEKQINLYETQLKEIDKNVDIAELKDELNNNSANIRGHYIGRLDKIKREITTIVGQIEREKDTKNQLVKDKSDLEIKEKDTIRQVSELTGKIDYDKSLMEDIEKSILDNYKEESIRDKKTMWEKRVKELAELKRKNADRQHVIKDSLKFIIESLSRSVKEKELCSGKLIEERLKLENIDKAQSELIQEIELKSHSLYISDTIYTKEESILGRLEEKRIHLKDAVEKALTDERINKRLVDLYKDANRFMADPLLEKAINHIQGDVGFVRHGVEYLTTAMELSEMTESELYALYPLWAISVVTTETDLPKVRKYLEKYQQDIMHQVIVITNEEINQLIKGEITYQAFGSGNALYPFSWEDNLVQEGYLQWKQSLIDQAKVYEENRIKVQNDYEEINAVYQKAMDYFRKYPYGTYNTLLQSVKELTNSFNELEGQIINLEDEKAKIERERDQLIESVSHYTDESNILENKIRQGANYLVIEDRYNHNQELLASKKKGQNDLAKEIENLKKKIEQQQAICQDLDHSKLEYESQKSGVQRENLFIQTKDFEPAYDKVDLTVLETERKIIEDKIKGLDVNRKTIIEMMDKEKESLKRNKESKTVKEREAKYDIFFIEVYLDNEEIELIDKEKMFHEELGKLQHKIRLENEKLIKVKTQKESKDQERRVHYDRIIEFTETLETVKHTIVEEKRELNNKRRVLNEQETSLKKELQELSDIITEIKVENGKHDFLSEYTKEMSYEENPFINFIYEKDKTLRHYLGRLEVAKGKYQDKREEINRERSVYITFCQKNIVDVKLRETAINGVRKNDNYKDLQGYQLQMDEVINRSIKLAEDDRRQSDLELQTFLTHLNTYIKNVAVELDAIQKKTKIKVDDTVKQIFIFDIPDWKEHEAKDELRKYIESVVEYYDEELDKNNVNEELLGRSIEEKLSVKNLLNVVMKDHSIKIKCRKVTNDMKINNAPMMWESSNKWSGGEKWSKNMTLFLGLLNYLAEKKQYLSLDQKRQRTVILDNPFGKASSKHVLDPVFFIADKLGFQIIALTAHAEGKFIRDYFPVVYSGRLRHTVDGEKQIMTNERAINYAYLREKSPRSLTRMEEQEQLNFFG